MMTHGSAHHRPSNAMVLRSHHRADRATCDMTLS